MKKPLTSLGAPVLPTSFTPNDTMYARHLDVNLLWIQKMKNVIVKPIKGTENPADLGTKALSRDKIRKYMKALGYKGEFIEEEEEPFQRVTWSHTQQEN